MSDTENGSLDPADPPETVPPGSAPQQPSDSDSSTDRQADRPETVPPTS